MNHPGRWLALVAAALTAGGAAAAATVDEARIVAAETDPAEWPAHGRTYREQRFSALTEIDADNVAGLGLAWSFELPTRRGQEATPIMVDGTLYFTGAWSQVFALDAASGELKWRYDPQVPRAWARYACCDVVNRGVAVWRGRVYAGSLDGRLFALDAETGERVWETLTVDQDKAYTITGAPRVVRDKIIIGNGGGEYGVRGYVSAYDADTGEMVWRFHTVPGNPDDGHETATMAFAATTWTGQWWQIGGGGTVWDSMAYDPELELLYIGVGNGSPWNRALRSPGGGDNLFLSSIVALEPDSGEYVWHYQTTPADNWDFTATQHMILADLTIDGRNRKVLMQAPKNGFFYVIDRETGEFISAENFVTVNWASHVNPETGRPVEALDNDYSERPRLTLPSPLGGHNWMPMAFSPLTGYVYFPAMDIPHTHGGDNVYPREETLWQTGTDPALAVAPVAVGPELERALARRLIKARLIAWDPVAQREVWRVPHPHPWNGGVLATAGNLVFQGDATGFFSAYRADDGELLWQRPANAGIVAAPISYELDGRQYVAVLAGWGGSAALFAGAINKQAAGGATGRLLVYRLGGDAEPPAGVAPSRIAQAPAPLDDTAQADVERGFVLYNRHCMVCHGFGAVGGGVITDLRHSADGVRDALPQIVLDGALEEAGMPSFRGRLSAADVAAIRAYLQHESLREWRRADDPGWWRAVKRTTAAAAAWAISVLQ